MSNTVKLAKNERVLKDSIRGDIGELIWFYARYI